MALKTPRRPTIFMMDLLATVPYYTAYLSRALLAEGATLQVGSISYYLDPGCFSTRNVPLDPGCVNIVGRFKLPRRTRRILKLLEAILNLFALTLRFLISPPDVIHVQYLPMLRWPLPLDSWFVEFCRERGSKIVLTVHDLLPHDTADTYRSIFEKLYQRVDAIICHSEHIRSRLAAEFGVEKRKVWTIPHGPFFYDLPDIGSRVGLNDLNMSPGQRMVLWQGILFPYKGLDILLDAWQTVESEVHDATLVVVGTGAPALLEQTREQVRRLGLKRVRLILRFTSAEELVSVYRAAEIVVYPYRAITTSGALATGLALGKAIVASDLPVFRELLTDQQTALLVQPGNSCELSAAIMKLLLNPDLRMAIVAAVVAKDFASQSWIDIAQQTSKVYGYVHSRTQDPPSGM